MGDRDRLMHSLAVLLCREGIAPPPEGAALGVWAEGRVLGVTAEHLDALVRQELAEPCGKVTKKGERRAKVWMQKAGVQNKGAQ